MQRLAPHGYCYLRHPVLSSGETMLQYAIQHLCFTGALKVQRKLVAAHQRDPRLVTRLLITRTKEARPSTRAEAHTLGLFPVHKEFSLGQLRGRFKKEDTDFERFKWEHVLPDMQEAGFLRSKYVRTSAGIDAMQNVRRTRKLVDREIDTLIAHDKPRLTSLLTELGSNIVLLKEETRDRLKGLVKELPELALTVNIRGTMDTMTAFDSFAAFDTLSMSDSFTSGDFGGFGDGDFGGGGAGDDW